MLKDADVPVDRCFFTNAFMGLCEGRDNKKYAGRTDQRFRTACLNFLSHQIHIQRPRLIVTLGRFVPPLLAYASSDLKAWADRCRGSDPMLTRKNMDENPILRFAQFDIGDGRQHGAAVVAISHPSDQRNGRARHPSGFPAGDAGGEIELIRAGWREPIL
jgi:uracil-DNA glycosylase